MEKTHRKLWRRILPVVLAVCLLVPTEIRWTAPDAEAVTQSEINKLKDQSKDLDQQKEDLQDKLDALAGDKADAMSKKSLLEQKINVIRSEIQNCDEQISAYADQISQKEAQITELKAKEEAQYELFCQRVRSMEETGSVSYLAILFDASSFSDLLDRAMLVGEIMDYDNDVIDMLKATRAQVEQAQSELEADKASAEAVKADQVSKKSELDSQMSQVDSLLKQIQSDAAEVQESKEELEAEAAEMDALIAKKQKELAAQIAANKIQFDAGTGYYWPLPSGNTTITSVFAGRIHPITGKYSFHNGVDVRAAGGTPIYAARGGVVLVSTYSSSYGNYVSISHGNSDSTLYGHMTSRAVSEGQVVKQGQLIGYVGSTGRSTGYHLHFEVRIGGSRVDPLSCYPSISFTYK